MEGFMDIELKELYSLIDSKHICNECDYFKGTAEIFGKTHYKCKLSNVLMPNNFACGLYNKDLSKEKICYNCDQFLGGGDWGLSCNLYYHTITMALNPQCLRMLTLTDFEENIKNEKQI